MIEAQAAHFSDSLLTFCVTCLPPPACTLQEYRPGEDAKGVTRYEHSPPRLLALHPRVRLDLVGGYEELAALVHGMREVRKKLGTDKGAVLPELAALRSP